MKHFSKFLFLVIFVGLVPTKDIFCSKKRPAESPGDGEPAHYSGRCRIIFGEGPHGDRLFATYQRIRQVQRGL